MNIEWINDDQYFHASLPEGENIVEAIRALVTKVLELAEEKEDWDCVMMDIWMYNLGRLICNVQRKDQAVGMDRGFRVALQIKEYHNMLEAAPSEQYPAVLNEVLECTELDIRHAFQNNEFLMSFDDLWKKNPFNIRLAREGQLSNIELNFT